MSFPAWPQDPSLTRDVAKKNKDGNSQAATAFGKTQTGKASYYGGKFAGRKMANGKPMDPNADIAASKSLPLGTTAKVTNLANGKSVTVKIEDRGPYVPGRIVDLSTKAAEKLDMKKQGVADVAVTPIATTSSDAKTSAGASDAGAGAASGE